MKYQHAACDKAIIEERLDDACEACRSHPYPPDSVNIQDNPGVHLSHCYQGEYRGFCKYGEEDCPAAPSPSTDSLEALLSLIERKIPEHHLKAKFIEDCKSALLTWRDAEVARAREKMYNGGEKLFVQMLLEHGGLSYSDSTPDDTVMIRIPKETIRKYFDGELKSLGGNKHE